MPLNVRIAFPDSAEGAAIAADSLTVRRYELRDAMSELFELRLEVLSPDPVMDDHAIVGQRAVVAFADEPFFRELTGIVREMVQRTSVVGGNSVYEWVIVPPVWLTTRRRDHRIFQHLDAADVVDAVLATYGDRVPPTQRLLGGYAPPEREYVVQYAESDYGFLSRILAEEGIATFFDHTRGSAWTLIEDTSTLAPSLAGPIPYREPFQGSESVGNLDTPHVQSAEIRSEVETSATTLRDYDFEKPDFLLEAQHRMPSGEAYENELPLEAYGYEVGRFSTSPAGEARASRRLEAHRSTRRRIVCTASFSLPAGARLSLQDHPRADMTGEFLVVRAQVVMDPDAGIRRHELELMDIRSCFRPPLRPKPRIHGTQTAVVVGAPGEEIDVDKYGRVEVEFRWDRRDRHAAGICRRVRVSQAWASGGYGLVALPRVKDEVIVAYLDGDPDEPIIVGRVHNAVVQTPLRLPAEKMISVWRSKSSPNSDGFNEIRMDDRAGAERLAIHAQHDYSSDTGHDAKTTVANDHALSVGQNHAATVGNNASTNVAGNHSVKVGGDEDVQVGGDRATSVGGDDKLTVSGNQRTGVGGDHSFDAKGIKIHGKTIDISADDVITIKAPMISISNDDSTILVMPGEISIHSPRIQLRAGGSMITMTSGEIVENADLIKLNP